MVFGILGISLVFERVGIFFWSFGKGYGVEERNVIDDICVDLKKCKKVMVSVLLGICNICLVLGRIGFFLSCKLSEDMELR